MAESLDNGGRFMAPELCAEQERSKLVVEELMDLSWGEGIHGSKMQVGQENI